MRNADINELYDNVQIGEIFAIVFTFDGFFSYKAGGFIKESEIFLNSTSSNVLKICYFSINLLYFLNSAVFVILFFSNFFFSTNFKTVLIRKKYEKYRKLI